jgi:transposase
MARAYWDDLRLKIFAAHANGHGSFRTLSRVFGVSLGYVEKIFRQRKKNGKGERVRHRPGPKSRVSPAVADRMVELVEANSDLTVAELRERIVADTGVEMSWSLVRLWVVRLGLRLKKVAPRSREGHGSESQAAQRVPRSDPRHSAGAIDLSG